MISPSHCDERCRKDGVHQVNSCSVFCFSLSNAWSTAPLTTHHPNLSQRQICSFPHVAFCVTHHCDVVINQFILTDSFVGEVVVMSSSCLTVVVKFSWGLTCPEHVSLFQKLSPTKLSCCWGPVWLSVHKLRAWCLCLLAF